MINKLTGQCPPPPISFLAFVAYPKRRSAASSFVHAIREAARATVNIKKKKKKLVRIRHRIGERSTNGRPLPFCRNGVRRAVPLCNHYV